MSLKIFIVDDSIISRQVLKYIAYLDGDIEVIGEARDGYQALQYLDDRSKPKPDLITMDLEMPGIDGFATTRRILESHAIPIVIISNAFNYPSAEKAMKALQAGAVAAVGKPPALGSPDFYRHARELAQLIKNSAKVKPRLRTADTAARNEPQSRLPSNLVLPQSPPRIIAIGASTGGPPVIQTLLSSLPADYPIPICIVQHIASGFARNFAEWLNNTCSIQCKLAEEGETIKKAVAYVAPNDVHLIVEKNDTLRFRLPRERDIIVPSIDTLFSSVAEQYGSQSAGILLTGMGRDGAQGLLKLKKAGAVTIAQDQESSAVFGMPGEALRLDAACCYMSPAEIAAVLNKIGMISKERERKE